MIPKIGLHILVKYIIGKFNKIDVHAKNTVKIITYNDSLFRLIFSLVLLRKKILIDNPMQAS